MKSSFSRFRALRLACLGSGLAALLAACGQTPGQTGLDYLRSEGIRLDAQVYKLTFDDLPLDSAFGTEVPLNHFGESLLVVGREGDYVAKARMGFQFSTQAQLDSLAQGLHFRITAIPVDTAQDSAKNFAGREYLLASSQRVDSMRVLVESFSFYDSVGGSYGDTLITYHRRLIATPQPFSTLDQGRRTRDTITIYPKRAYPNRGVVADSSQFGALPNLRARLRSVADSTRRWSVFVELSPLTAADSGMFRFIGQAATTNETELRRYNSGLWSGRVNKDSLTTVGVPVRPYFSGVRPSTNFEVRHTGTSTNTVLLGVARGVHLRVNRDTLMNRIRLKLNAYDPATPNLGDSLMRPVASVNFDRRFFVPYAVMRLPIDSALTRVPKPFAIDMSVSTDVDSLGNDTASFRDDLVLNAGNDSLTLVVNGGPSSARTDNLIVKYRAHPGDASLRLLTTYWAGAPTVADTFVVENPDGRHRELTLTRRTGWQRSAVLSVKPSASQLRVEVFFNVGALTEANNIKDSTGKDISSPRLLASRFYRPGADSLSVRVTRGLRNLLNRNYNTGISVAPDMVLRAVERRVYDTSAVKGASYAEVFYPVTGEVAFKRTGGRLVVGLDLYLYPLEAGR